MSSTVATGLRLWFDVFLPQLNDLQRPAAAAHQISVQALNDITNTLCQS